MPRLYRADNGTVFEADDDAFDNSGCLKDGHTLRVPMQFRDSNRGVADAPRLRFADGRTDVPVGSRPGFIVDTGDGERIRYEAYLASVRELADAWKQPGAGSAYHGSTGAAPRHPISAADAQALRDAAYREMCHELANAWRRA
jgi:hypothetical protein